MGMFYLTDVVVKSGDPHNRYYIKDFRLSSSYYWRERCDDSINIRS